MLTETSSSGIASGSTDSQRCDGTRLPKYRIETCAVDSPARTIAESFVQDAFYRTHRARIATFMPTLLLLRDVAGTVRGVAGCRFAESDRLYLERYLTRPIEQLMSDRFRSAVKRSHIVEVGNFASAGSRAARRFMAHLPYFLLSHGRSWVTFTATAPVRRMLEHLGARCMDLGPAHGACARSGADEWGRYYTHDPRVMAGYLPLARKIPSLIDAAYAD